MREAYARAALAAVGLRLYERGLVAGTSGNVSARLDDGTLLVTPTGRALRTLDPDDLVVCEPDGTPRDPSRRPTSELPLHIAAYRVRSDARFVVHTHPTHCVAWSKTGRLFDLDTVGAIESLGPIALVPYAPSGTHLLADLCARAFARGIDTVVMARHGLSSVAAELETAFARTDLAEQTAHIEYAASLLRTANGFTMPAPRPDFPYDDLRSHSDDPEYRSALEAFAAEYATDRPDHARLAEHARTVATEPSESPFARWWHDPHTQAFIAELTATGL